MIIEIIMMSFLGKAEHGSENCTNTAVNECTPLHVRVVMLMLEAHVNANLIR